MSISTQTVVFVSYLRKSWVAHITPTCSCRKEIFSSFSFLWKLPCPTANAFSEKPSQILSTILSAKRPNLALPNSHWQRCIKTLSEVIDIAALNHCTRQHCCIKPPNVSPSNQSLLSNSTIRQGMSSSTGKFWWQQVIRQSPAGRLNTTFLVLCNIEESC